MPEPSASMQLILARLLPLIATPAPCLQLLYSGAPMTSIAATSTAEASALCEVLCSNCQDSPPWLHQLCRGAVQVSEGRQPRLWLPKSCLKLSALQEVQARCQAWQAPGPNTTGVHELLATFFSCFTKAFTMWLARSAPRETRCRCEHEG